MVSQVYAHTKVDQTVHFKYLQFIVLQLYPNKVEKRSQATKKILRIVL